jgi:organic radical activating enzyme
MIEIKKIESMMPDNLLRVELFLSDYCNYKCWYCTPEFWGKNYKWPELKSFQENIFHLFKHYEKLGKDKFLIHIGGGEPTIWPDLINFINFIKKNFKSLVSVTSNCSRSLNWWEENSKNFDHIHMSVHFEKAIPEHLKNVGDILYKNNCGLYSSVLMDPNHWDRCLEIIETLKSSKYQWSITSCQIVHKDINYTEDQFYFLKNKNIRRPAFFKSFFTQRPKYSKPKITFSNNKTERIREHWLNLHGYNNFEGWLCNVGVDTIFIDKKGNIRGSCGTTLYGEDFYYNIYDTEFSKKFNTNLNPIICRMKRCACQPEITCTKTNLMLK